MFYVFLVCSLKLPLHFSCKRTPGKCGLGRTRIWCRWCFQPPNFKNLKKEKGRSVGVVCVWPGAWFAWRLQLLSSCTQSLEVHLSASVRGSHAVSHIRELLSENATLRESSSEAARLGVQSRLWANLEETPKLLPHSQHLRTCFLLYAFGWQLWQGSPSQVKRVLQAVRLSACRSWRKPRRSCSAARSS